MSYLSYFHSVSGYFIMVFDLTIALILISAAMLLYPKSLMSWVFNSQISSQDFQRLQALWQLPHQKHQQQLLQLQVVEVELLLCQMLMLTFRPVLITSVENKNCFLQSGGATYHGCFSSGHLIVIFKDILSCSHNGGIISF